MSPTDPANSAVADEEIESWFEDEDSVETPSATAPVDIEEKYRTTQVKIVRSNMDFTLFQIHSFLKEGTYLLISPEYQRRYRWDKRRKSRLIESLLLNIPIPPIFLYEKEYGIYEVLDGRQRLLAIRSFLDDEFPLFDLEYWKELEGKRFSQFPAIIQKGLTRRTLTATVLLAETQTPKDFSQDVRLILFNRLNTGGEKLNPQEIRNALYAGRFNQALVSLAQHSAFATAWRIPQDPNYPKQAPSVQLAKNNLFKTMADCELVLRFFGIRETINHRLRGSLKTILNKTMELFQEATETEVSSLSTDFRAAIDSLVEILGEHPFDLPQSGRPSRPLYDALMVAVDKLRSQKTALADSAVVKQRLTDALSDAKRGGRYDILVGRANTVDAIRERVDLATQLLAG